MLTPLRDVAGQPLRWVRPSVLRRDYELRAGASTVATLRLTGLFGHRAEAETEETRWVLTPHGLFHQKVVVTRGDSDVEVASMRSGLVGEGVVTVGDGRRYEWKRANFWLTRWTLWDGGTHSPVFHLARRVLYGQEKARVTVETSAYQLPDLPLLLVATWQCVLLHHRRHAS